MAIVFVDGQYSHIQCDGDGCAEKSPSPKEMIEHHGLSNMGWWVGGGIHRCPKHYTEITVARGPLFFETQNGKLVRVKVLNRR